ncbi:patatin-like phospholipase domain-containing protein 4 [Amphiura filiformis]|uniref:patatin-like phospholipase domain-containing protein 4 n=1 Tax=Amphiura filiformis TaxID=82378 RepID=UPI003B214BA3
MSSEGDSGFNVMFVGTSFMGIYNVGSAQCLLDHGKGVMHRTRCVGGASAAAIIASILLSAPERLLDYKETIYELSNHIHGLDKGANTSGFDIIAHVRGVLEEFLKPDAHIQCSGRMSVPLTELLPVHETEFKSHHKQQTDKVSPRSPRGASLTPVQMGGQTWRFGSRRVVSKFYSREELIEVLLSSIYVPWFDDWKPPMYADRYWVDGSIGTTNIGVEDMDFPPGRLITVSPDKKFAHAKPQDNITTEWRDVSNESFQLQPFNMYRVSGALYPPPQGQLREQFRDGVEDAKIFLSKFGLYEQGLNSLRNEGPLGQF